MRASPSQSQAPIFIVGAPRSGTTMVRLLLNAHPHIAIPEETKFFEELARATPYPRAPWSALVALTLELCGSAFTPAISLTKVERELLGHPGELGLLLALPMSQWAASQDKIRWGEKTPFHMLYLDRIVTLFPDARVIAIKRDPRDVVASMKRYFHLGQDTALNACLWRDVWTIGLDLFETVVPASQRLLVEYDELVNEPESVVRSICEFIDEPYDPALLDFGDTASRYVSVLRTPKLTRAITPPEGTFRDQLSAREIATVELICGSAMRDLGYAPVGTRASLATRANVGAKLLYVRTKQLQHRREQYHGVTYMPFGRLRRLVRHLRSRTRARKR